MDLSLDDVYKFFAAGVLGLGFEILATEELLVLHRFCRLFFSNVFEFE